MSSIITDVRPAFFSPVFSDSYHTKEQLPRYQVNCLIYIVFLTYGFQVFIRRWLKTKQPHLEIVKTAR